jgi:hypothetical protein
VMMPKGRAGNGIAYANADILPAPKLWLHIRISVIENSQISGARTPQRASKTTRRSDLDGNLFLSSGKRLKIDE